MNLKNILDQLHSEQEALMLFSALGFSVADWPTLEKLGKPRFLLASELLAEALKTQPQLEARLKNIRVRLDRFYELDGALLSPVLTPYPRLFRSAKSPLVFFSRFNHALLARMPAVAIVGSRTASKEGQEQSFLLASRLASQGFNIVSGGALGIDRAAHQGALEAGGTTIIISGNACSLQSDWFYEHFKEKYRDQSAVVYPFGPLTPQGKYMFVERNRFVVALADALIVVQGQRGSGTLHTVKFAKKLGVPIFAVPGALKDPLSFVPNALLASKEAGALVDFDQDFKALLGFSRPKVQKAPVLAKVPPKSTSLRPDLPKLLQLFLKNGRALSMPELILKTERSFLELQKELLTYELKGLIVKRGPQFVLTDN